MTAGIVSRMKNANVNMPRPGMPRRRNAEQGQSLLEFALMLPFLILLAVGVVELGRAVYYTVAINNAATAGVEYGAQTEITASDLTGMTKSAVCDANGGSPTTGCRSGILTTSNVTVWNGCTCDNNDAGISCNPMPAPGSCPANFACSGQIVECVEVQTTATYPSLFHYPLLPSSYTANGKAVMRVRK